MNDNWIKDITIDDMPNTDMRLVAEACGIDVAVKLLEEMGGIQLSIPKNGFKKVIAKCICDNYNGRNAKELALKCNVTERYVYKLCSNGDDERQMNFLRDISR